MVELLQVMKRALILQIFLLALHSSLSLELDYQDVTYVKIGETAFLKCAVTTPYPIKELWWFRFDDPEETIYYYDPLLTDTALLNRAKRSREDNTSLIINPTYLSDEGEYQCRIVVWNTLNNSAKSPVPITNEARMILKVDVPPERVEVTHLTSGRNLSLRCTSVGSKPEANIFWTKTSLDGEETEIEVVHKNTEIEKTGKLFDVSERLFYTLEDFEPIARISCVVKHDATDTILYKNITFVSPVIQNAVSILMERFEDPVVYSSFENQYANDEAAGLVQISADPGFQVLYNTSLTLSASAPGVFPEPSFIWWTGDQTGISGAELTIENLQENNEYYVLAENPLGRVVLSVNVYVTDDVGPGSLNGNDTTGDGAATSQAGLDGAIIGAIVAGSLLASFLIVFAVWYLCIRDQSHGINVKAKQSPDIPEEEESLPFRPSEKPLMRTTSTQTLEGRRSRREASLKGAASADDILNKAPARAHGTPPPGYKSKERPRSRKLTAYDESASFVGDYASQNTVAYSSSDDNLRSAQEGDESRSERSLLSSDGGHVTGHTNFV